MIAISEEKRLLLEKHIFQKKKVPNSSYIQRVCEFPVLLGELSLSKPVLRTIMTIINDIRVLW